MLFEIIPIFKENVTEFGIFTTNNDYINYPSVDAPSAFKKKKTFESR